MTAAEPILRIEQASKRFGGVVALDKITFDLWPGEVLGLIGPNGAGKTTLVNLITGASRATSGSILFRGRQLVGLPAHRIGPLGVARTFQLMRPFPRLTVLENVAVGAMFGAGGAGRSAQQAMEKAGGVLELVKLADRADEAAASLPVGGRKRLELARALAMEPQLLLMDEVLAGLRGAEMDEAIGVVQAIHERGITLIVIEHVMKVIVGLCSRVVVLDYGRLIAIGTPAEVTSNPAVIQAYLGKKYAQTMAQT